MEQRTKHIIGETVSNISKPVGYYDACYYSLFSRVLDCTTDTPRFWQLTVLV